MDLVLAGRGGTAHAEGMGHVKRLRDYDALELAVAALFFIGGSILALAFAVVVIGTAALNLLAEHSSIWFFE